MQHTLKSPVRFAGLGLHSGKTAHMIVRPAPAGHGIKFLRTDIALGDAVIPARWDLARQTPLQTRLENAAGAHVATVEHIMAALAGAGVHNALVEIDTPEVPILDGSSLPFLLGIMRVGLTRQDVPLKALRILREVGLRHGDAVARLMPADEFEMHFAIDFPDPAIGRQEKTMNLRNGSFARELCDSRTFCRLSDVEAMHKAGLALGGTIDNAVVVDGDRILTPGGLRHDDEAVRHKMLDALGDLALAGGPILGRYEGERAGHSVTNMLLRELFDQPEAFEWVDLTPAMAARMPGAGLVLEEVPAVA